MFLNGHRPSGVKGVALLLDNFLTTAARRTPGQRTCLRHTHKAYGETMQTLDLEQLGPLGVDRTTVAQLTLSGALQEAADRWSEWSLPAECVTVEHIRRWAEEARRGAADAFVRWLRFGDVYGAAPVPQRKALREAWTTSRGPGISRSHACAAQRAVEYVRTQLQGIVPQDIEGPRALIDLEAKHRLGQKADAKAALKTIKEREEAIAAEELAESEQDSGKPDTDPVEEHPVRHGVLTIRRWMSENLDPLPLVYIEGLEAIARELRQRLPQ